MLHINVHKINLAGLARQSMDASQALDCVLIKSIIRRRDVGSDERAATYAFLLCAARSARSSPPSQRRSAGTRRQRSKHQLCRLPHDVIQHIARLAYASPYVAEFTTDWNRPWTFDYLLRNRLMELDCRMSELAVTSVSFHADESLDHLALARPIINSLVYLEFTLSPVWFGTCFLCQYGGSAMMLRFFMEEDEHGDQLTGDPEDDARVGLFVDDQFYGVPAFGNNWTYLEDTVTVGLLVDTVRGCVTFHMNDIDGPCLPLGGSDWKQSGVFVYVSDFVDSPSLDDYTTEVTVSTPPCPPSLLRAAVPKSADEHTADASLIHVPDDHQAHENARRDLATAFDSFM
jgi:hypothetical protein